MFGNVWRGKAAVLAIMICMPTWVSARADEPLRVSFDMGYALPVTQVDPRLAADLLPDEQAILARLVISPRIRSGQESQLRELSITIQPQEAGVRVLDWSPQTASATDVAGQIDVVLRKEQEKSYDLAGEAGIPLLFQGIPGSAAGRARAAELASTVSEGKYTQLPEKTWVVTSGTVGRESGVFFKLRPHGQTTVEGSQEFLLMLAVPLDWQAGVAQVECVAFAQDRSEKGGVCGAALAQVGLYEAKNGDARKEALELAEAAKLKTRALLRNEPNRKNGNPLDALRVSRLDPIPGKPLVALERNVNELSEALRPLLNPESLPLPQRVRR